MLANVGKSGYPEYRKYSYNSKKKKKKKSTQLTYTVGKRF